MEAQIQLQKNATVLTTDGESVGQVDRVVLNPETKVVTHVVVGKGLFKTDEKVVPIDMVTETNDNQVVLREEAGSLKSFPPFEETHLIDAGSDYQGGSPASANIPPTMLGTQGAGVSLMPASRDRFNTQIEQNIPEGTVALKEGAKVITAEGKRVGSVERVVADAPADRASYLFVKVGRFAGETKMIPITWVRDLSEDEIHLRVHKDAIEELAGVS